MSNNEETSQTRATEDAQADIEISSISSCPVQTLPASSPGSCDYSRHTNLDSTQPLTLTEKLRLNCIYHLRPLRILRYLATLACIAWTIVSISSLLPRYLEHRTNAIVLYTSPNWTYPPAISICTECILCRYAYENISLPHDVYLPDLLANNRIIALLNGSERVTEDTRVPEVDIAIDCAFINFTMTPTEYQIAKSCTKFSRMITSISRGSKCYSFYSDIYGQLSSGNNTENLKMFFVYAPTFNLRISGQWLYAPYSEAYLVVHSADVHPGIVNSRWHLLKEGKYLDYRFGKEEWHLRGPPNRPACFVYRKGANSRTLPEDLHYQSVFSDVLATPDGTPLYRSMYECYLYCIWRQLYTNNSVNLFVDITVELLHRIERLYRRRRLTQIHRYGNGTHEGSRKGKTGFLIKFRPLTLDSILEHTTAQRRCLNLCVTSCEINAFPEAIVQVEDYPLDETAAYVSIQWATQPVTSISYNEELDLPQVVGYVGGHLHVWLSLSALAVIGYLVRRLGEWQGAPWHRCVWLFKRTSQ